MNAGQGGVDDITAPQRVEECPPRALIFLEPSRLMNLKNGLWWDVTSR
jgi:hypothetical protein